MESGLPLGLPTNIQHDMHRLVGWSSTIGHLIDGSMVRVIGMIIEAESDSEKAKLEEVASRYWDRHHEHGTDAFKADLVQRVRPAELDDTTRHLRIEAFVAARTGIASELYPEFFDVSSEHVDKDGLVDYQFLLRRAKMLQPGVFLDEARQLLLFAHRFFRRSLSHRNKLNEYFLDSYVQAAAESTLQPRLRLDPDMVGHPSTHRGLVESEYWHGPKFTDDIEAIPSGVAVHSATERTRQYEGVDKTHIWWKPEESREGDGLSESFRTFEVEELIDNPSPGLPGERYGCRYAHAEYSSSKAAITHFDGAIRAYPAEAYLERIEVNIDRAGKHSEYTKLFRFDGPMPVEQWKRLLSDYFRGNPLIPEYLGGSNPEDSLAPDSESQQVSEACGVSAQDALCVLIQQMPGVPPASLDIERTVVVLSNDYKAQFVETGLGSVDKLLRSMIDLSGVASHCKDDGFLELPRLFFALDDRFPASMHETVTALSAALRDDIDERQLRAIALALVWPRDGLLTSLSIRGPATLVPRLLDRLLLVVNPTGPASSWVEDLSAFVRELSPLASPCGDLRGALKGRLALQRDDTIDSDVIFPPELVLELQSRGLFAAP